MIECETTARKWGNSLGVTLPKELIEKEHIKENDKVKILVIKQDDTLKRTFGILKGKLGKDTQKIKDQIRRELYND